MKTTLSPHNLAQFFLSSLLAASDAARAYAAPAASLNNVVDSPHKGGWPVKLPTNASTLSVAPSPSTRQTNGSLPHGRNDFPTYTSECWAELVDSNAAYPPHFDSPFENFYFEVVRNRNISFVALDDGRHTGTVGPLEITRQSWALSNTIIRVYGGDHNPPALDVGTSGGDSPTYGHIKILDENISNRLNYALEQRFGRSDWSQDFGGWRATIDPSGVNIRSLAYWRTVSLNQACSKPKASPDDYLLKEKYPLYVSQDKRISNNEGTQKGALVSKSHYEDADGCYVACYSKSSGTAFSPVDDAGVFGQVRVAGKYVDSLCVPHGSFLDFDLSRSQNLTGLCDTYFPGCADDACWAGGDTGGWLGLYADRAPEELVVTK